MKKQQRSLLIIVLAALFMTAGLFMPAQSLSGDLEPPAEAVDGSGNPAPTMHTLEDIYNRLEIMEGLERANICIETGNRFCDLGDGTVVDTATHLIWLKNANCFGEMKWYDATDAAAALADGQCGLSDGSRAGDWRLPTKEELEGIGTDPPATWYSGYPDVTWTMPGTPFTNVQSNYYWSSSSYAGYTTDAWIVPMYYGYVGYHNKKVYLYYVWPVRGGN